MRDIERITSAVGRMILDECHACPRITDRRIQSALKPNVSVFMSPTEPLLLPMLLFQQPAISYGKWETRFYSVCAELRVHQQINE